MFKFLFQDVQDRLNGNKAKANARLGLVNAPEGTGKLIWLVADGSQDSVLMAAALLAAIREKRKDVRLVLTYETEYRDLLVSHFNGLPKIGFGYGVGDNKLAARQMIKRLSPLAVIFVGHQPHQSLLDALAEQPSIHKVAFQFSPDYYPQTVPNTVFYEACYPNSMTEKKPDNERFSTVSPEFNVLTRLVQSQIDKQLGAMLCGEKNEALFQLHNLSVDDMESTLKEWGRSSISKKTLLALSFAQVNVESVKKMVDKAGCVPVLLSQWNQRALSKNEVVIADEGKWYAALCTASAATHLFSTDQVHCWQALSSGAVISYNKQLRIAKSFSNTLKTPENPSDIYAYWGALLASPTQQRKASDDIRKIFWNERRQAETQVNTLLQSVYEW